MPYIIIIIIIPDHHAVAVLTQGGRLAVHAAVRTEISMPYPNGTRRRFSSSGRGGGIDFKNRSF